MTTKQTPTATDLLRDLLNVSELNMDDMEPETCALVNEAHIFLILKRLADNQLRDALESIEQVLADHPDADKGNSKVHFALMKARAATAF